MADPVGDTLARIADAVLADPSRFGDVIVDDIVAALPDLGQDPRMRELLSSTVLDTVVSGLRVMGSESQPEEVHAPFAALELARRLAQQGVPLTALLRAYRLGQAAFQQAMIAEIATRAVSAADVAAAAQQLSAIGFRVVDTSTEDVIAAYQSERDDWVRRRDAARLARVTGVIAGRVGDVREIERALGYGLAATHVGAVLWCGADVSEADRLTALERHVPRLASAFGSTRAPLVVAPDASTLWVWIASPAADVPTVAASLPAAGVNVALGDPAAQLPGFRRTHQQAAQAQAVAVRADPSQVPRVIAASQLGPLTLLAADGPATAAWVQSVLGGLADDDEACARLRETVWSYLSSGGSHAAAAAELHVHKNTVQYRVRRAEEVRGRPLQEGRLDVEVALLACRWLGSAVLRPVAAGER